MPYKDPEIRRQKCKEKYHANKEKRREYQKAYYAKNKERLAAANRERYANQREVYYERMIYNRYGITLADYDRMLEEQNGVCKICEGTCDHPQRRNLGTLSIDHCHTTGKVRGLLCNKCNSLLGWAKDDTNTLKKAIEYLETSYTE